VTTSLPRPVITFLRANVDDVLKLNLLLLLHRTPGCVVSVQSAAGGLGATGDQIVDAAVSLAQRGLIKIGPAQLELVAPIEDRLTIADLATWCVRDRTQVMSVIYGS
jgi:hypothetical protein